MSLDVEPLRDIEDIPKPGAVLGISAKTLVALLLVATSLVFEGCGGGRKDRGLTIVAPITAWTWPMYIAKEGGYYEKHGLEVHLVFANHPAGVAMLTSREAEVNLLPLERAMELIAKDTSFVGLLYECWKLEGDYDIDSRKTFLLKVWNISICRPCDFIATAALLRSIRANHRGDCPAGNRGGISWGQRYSYS
jgi:NMT1/THI5 like